MGRIQMRETNYLQIITSGLHRTAGPYRSTWSSDVDRPPRDGAPSCVTTHRTSPPWTCLLFPTPPIHPSVSLRQGQRWDFDRSVFRCARADDRLLSQFRVVPEMYAATMDILVLQIFNSLFYASVLFLIAAGLSLIFGVMRIVNMAHGTFYAVGAFVTAWLVGRAIALGVPAAWTFLLIPVGAGAVALLGVVIEPLLRPFYRRAEEYQLLVTFGLLLILEDVIRLLWGGLPLSADPAMDVLPSIRIGGLIYPGYNLVVIATGIVAAVGLWAIIYRTKFGVLLRGTSQDRRMASALSINVGLVYVSAFAIGCVMAGLGGAIIVPSQAAVLGMGIDALVLAFVVVVIGGLGSLQGALVGALIVSFVRTAGIQFFPEIELAVLYLIAAAVLLVRPTGLFGRA